MILALLLACAGNDPGTDPDDAVDLRLTEADLPELSAGQFAWWGPDTVVEPYQDVMSCVFGTYEGEDVGLTEFAVYQSPYGHHLQLMGTTLSPVDAADEAVLDCTETSSLAMSDLEPLMLPTSTNYSSVDFDLPDGMAVKLDHGQRYVLQSHWINTDDEPVRLQDAAIFTTVPVEAVETWAAPLVANHTTFEIPPGESASLSFDCAYDQDFNILALLGHMHEHGKSFATEVVDPQGDVERVYEIPEWEASYRDAAPQDWYEAGELVLRAGDTLRTHCEWFNDTDTVLDFPAEMCVTVTVAYPSLTPVICSD